MTVPTLHLPDGTPATLADVRAWLRNRGLDVRGKVLGEWITRRAGDYDCVVLVSLAGGSLGYYYRGTKGWRWATNGVNGFGQVVATEDEARAGVEARLVARGWRWP